MSEARRDRRQFLKAAGVAGIGASAVLGGAQAAKAQCTPPSGASGDGYYNVLDYCAVGDGTTNDRDAFQDALDAAAANGGGTVLVPAGTYKIDTTTNGPLDVHEGCGIVGVGGAIIRDAFGTPTHRGPLILVTSTTNSVLNLFRGVLVDNLSFFWPDQEPDDTDAYPAAIIGAKGIGGDTLDYNARASGRIRNLYFYNAWEAFDFGTTSGASAGGFTIENIKAFVYKRFLRTLDTSASIYLTDIFISYANFSTITSESNAVSYAQDNCVLIETDRCDGLKVHNFQAFQCNTFLKLVGEHVLNLAEFSNVSLDAVPRLIMADGSPAETGTNNCIFTNCLFRCTADATGNGADNAMDLTYEKASGSGAAHNLTFSNCIFRGAMRRFLYINAAASPSDVGLEYLRFIGCHFTQWGATEDTSALAAGQNIAAIDVDDPALNIEVQDCTFVGVDSELTTPHLMQGIRVADYSTAKITGCTFYNCHKPIVVFDGDTLMVTNNITRGTDSASSLALGGSGPATDLVANNIFDKASAL